MRASPHAPIIVANSIKGLRITKDGRRVLLTKVLLVSSCRRGG